MKILTKSFLFLLLICTSFAYGQTITSRIIDSTTQKPIPYVTVLLANKKGVISNEEGKFSLQLNESVKESDTLFISCMGYETIAKPLNKFTEEVIVLNPRTIELNEVFVSSKNFTVEEIIEKVKENLDKNYGKDLSRKRLFLRESDFQNLSKTNYTFKKSTIPALNKQFLDSVLDIIPKKYAYYSEILCDFYGNQEKDQQKIKLIKASELYDKNNEIGIEAMENKFNEILKKNIKPDSYLKIKSGWFGTKVDADEVLNTDETTEKETLEKELKEQKEKEEERKNFAEYRKKTVKGLMDNLFYMDDTNLNFINKSRKYTFELKDYSYIGNQPVYVLNFKPKGNADYKGTLYIDIDDFAIIRADYANVKSLRTFNLLGISFNEYLSKGKMIFSKEANAVYSLLFLEHETGGRFGIRRPLKIVEKNKNVKGRRKQNELVLKLDMATNFVRKYELVVFDTEKITSSYFQSLEEKKDQLPTYMPAYDPEFWKGYNIIEPNQAIKEFTAEE
ncbi:carboxypeptidase-like regulatory domain-containing protein [Ascidiimonas sp. W6]|uniref:carboxypeptidase-like regulatory domain-containing protein n=1 Tax=Ascidiimonas meishanensis TaxID=3128903 RepID=UPI0030ED01AC